MKNVTRKFLIFNINNQGCFFYEDRMFYYHEEEYKEYIVTDIEEIVKILTNCIPTVLLKTNPFSKRKVLYNNNYYPDYYGKIIFRKMPVDKIKSFVFYEKYSLINKDYTYSELQKRMFAPDFVAWEQHKRTSLKLL